LNPNVKRNNDKKQQVSNKSDLFLSSEGQVLKIIKKSNTDLEDLDIIYDCFNKHFFIQSLDKEYRYI